jgi:hypothetical protein
MQNNEKNINNRRIYTNQCQHLHSWESETKSNDDAFLGLFKRKGRFFCGERHARSTIKRGDLIFSNFLQ